MTVPDKPSDPPDSPRKLLPAPDANAPWLVGMFLVAEIVLLFAASRLGDFTLPTRALRFVAIMSGASLCFLMAVLAFEKYRLRRAPWFFWGGAIAIRLAMLSCWPGDDMWRYLWEGRIQLEGYNPYVHAPLATALQHARDDIWPRINHPESPAIYPPAAEVTFAALAAVSPTVIAFKLLFVAADLVTAWLIVRLCTDAPVRGSPENAHAVAAWYAWNPAVAYAFAGAGHYDSLMLCAMTAGIWSFVRPRREAGIRKVAAHDEHAETTGDSPDSGARRWVRDFVSALCLGIAGAFKVVPLFLLPAWFAASRWWSAVLLGAVVIPAALCWWYGGIAVVFTPLIAFTEVTRFQDLFWWAIETLTIPNPFQRNWPFVAMLVLACLVVAIRFRRDWQRAALWIMGLMLVLSPVLHPWYVTWILPLAVWQRVRAWTVLSLSALFSLVLWESTRWWNQWEPNALTRCVVILPVIFAWMIEVQSSRRRITPV
jgi:hypothetical protein